MWFFPYSIYSYESDGHGGRIKVKRKSGKHRSKAGGGKGGKGGKDGKGGKRGGGPRGDMSDFEYVNIFRISYFSQIPHY